MAKRGTTTRVATTAAAAVVKPPVTRSEGQRMLCCVTGSLSAIASKIGAKSPQSVHCWRSGDKTPSANARAQMWNVLGIPERAWFVLPGSALEPAAPDDDTGANAPTSLEDCLALLQVIRRDRMSSGLEPRSRVKLADAEARILALRSRLEQAAELAESRYVADHPSWRRLRDLILQALEPHPDAARDVLAAIKKGNAS